MLIFSTSIYTAYRGAPPPQYIRAAIRHAGSRDFVLLISPNIPDNPEIIKELSRWNQDKNAPLIVPLTCAAFGECLQCFNDWQVTEKVKIPDTVLKGFYENIAGSIATRCRTGKKVEQQIRDHISVALGNIKHSFLQELLARKRGKDQSKDRGRGYDD